MDAEQSQEELLMKKGLSLALAFAGALACSVHGQKSEHTEVIKHTSNNPSIGIVSYKGTGDVRKKLEDMLERCGWFNVARGGKAASSDVKLSVTETVNGGLQMSVGAGGSSFKVDRGSMAGDEAIRQSVDDILKELFNVKALCTQKIYYVVTGENNLKEIYCCYLDGTGQERVTHNGAISTEPGWGHRNAMVYTLARLNALSIVMVDIQRGMQRVVSKSPGLNASAGLSHSGSMLALPLSAQNQVDLYYIDLANGNRHVRLTKDRNVESSPCWSPDDKKICYVSDKLGVPQLYLRDVADGGREIRISTGNNECVSPDWSNVTNKLCFSMKDNMGQRVICVMDMANSAHPFKVVTHAAGSWEAPSWGPDGRHIVCTRADASGKSRDLYIVDSWSNSFRPISKGAKLSLPAWRPAY